MARSSIDGDARRDGRADGGAAAYRERYLAPIGPGHETPAEFQHAALVEALGHSRGD